MGFPCAKFDFLSLNILVQYALCGSTSYFWPSDERVIITVVWALF